VIRTLSALLLTALAASSLVAQGPLVGNGTCTPHKGDNEYELLSFYTAPITFSPGGFIESLKSGAVRISVDATYVPTPGDDIRQPERCYGQQKTENTDLTPVFPRPRLTLGLPARFFLEASYLPPITVQDATPNLLSVAFGRVQTVRSGAHPVLLQLRAHGTVGRVRGPITCPQEVVQQQTASRACYGAAPSEDTYRPNMFGGEAALAMSDANERKTAYIGTGATRIVPRFKVGFLQADNYLDETRIRVNRTVVPIFAGGSYKIWPRVGVSAEIYAVPGDLVTGRLGGRWIVR
jgi:hypothetical protein